MDAARPQPTGAHDGDEDRTGHPADDRDLTAEDRDRTSNAHDEASDARDERAEARDARAVLREEATDSVDSAAVSDRAGARRDRQGGASDRKHSEHDREAASTDRALSALDRDAVLVDALTGAHRRDAGIMELERETARAHRTNRPFVLAFVDVDGLKATNDSLGHDAGDQLLRLVVDTIRSHTRSYDLIVRYGGDEFLCGLPELSMAEAAERFALVNADLSLTGHASVTAGLAELGANDDLKDLIMRADEALYREREQRASVRD